jgi:hypothetical protein
MVVIPCTMQKDKGNLEHLGTNMNTKNLVFKSMDESENVLVSLPSMGVRGWNETKIIIIYVRL